MKMPSTFTLLSSLALPFNTLFGRRVGLFPQMDVASTARALVERGLASDLSIGPVLADRIVAECGRHTRVGPHLGSPVVRALAGDDRILAVGRHYFEAEPRFHQSYLVWTAGGEGSERGLDREIVCLRALTFCVYLTDVDVRCSPHQLVVGERTATLLGSRGTAWFQDKAVLHRTAPHPQPNGCGTLLLTYTYTSPRRSAHG